MAGEGFAVRATPAAASAIDGLTEAIDDAPAGARGGVLELYDSETAMVEILEPELGGAARIVFAPLGKLRIVDPAP